MERSICTSGQEITSFCLQRKVININIEAGVQSFPLNERGCWKYLEIFTTVEPADYFGNAPECNWTDVQTNQINKVCDVDREEHAGRTILYVVDVY